jgi:hypothetical protein
MINACLFLSLVGGLAALLTWAATTWLWRGSLEWNPPPGRLLVSARPAGVAIRRTERDHATELQVAAGVDDGDPSGLGPRDVDVVGDVWAEVLQRRRFGRSSRLAV